MKESVCVSKVKAITNLKALSLKFLKFYNIMSNFECALPSVLLCILEELLTLLYDF